jgi:hypothetical protein
LLGEILVGLMPPRRREPIFAPRQIDHIARHGPHAEADTEQQHGHHKANQRHRLHVGLARHPTVGLTRPVEMRGDLFRQDALGTYQARGTQNGQHQQHKEGRTQSSNRVHSRFRLSSLRRHRTLA